MVNGNSNCFYLIILFGCFIGKSSSQFTLVSCYECTNCTDPFNSTGVSVMNSRCNTCYKLAITVAYAPYVYVIRRCLEACVETSQSFAGGSVTSTCCASNLCNQSSKLKFPDISRYFLFVLIIRNFLKGFFMY